MKIKENWNFRLDSLKMIFIISWCQEGVIREKSLKKKVIHGGIQKLWERAAQVWKGELWQINIRTFFNKIIFLWGKKKRKTISTINLNFSKVFHVSWHGNINFVWGKRPEINRVIIRRMNSLKWRGCKQVIPKRKSITLVTSRSKTSTGKILFNNSISDLGTDIRNIITKFAKDTMLETPSSSSWGILQKDLDDFENCSNRN